MTPHYFGVNRCAGSRFLQRRREPPGVNGCSFPCVSARHARTAGSTHVNRSREQRRHFDGEKRVHRYLRNRMRGGGRRKLHLQRASVMAFTVRAFVIDVPPPPLGEKANTINPSTGLKTISIRSRVRRINPIQQCFLNFLRSPLEYFFYAEYPYE